MTTGQAEVLTVGAALDLSAQQCASRHLDDTASWLSELALSGDPAVLEAIAQHLSSPTSLRTAQLPSSALRPSGEKLVQEARVVETDRDGTEDSESWSSLLQMDALLILPLEHMARLLAWQYQSSAPPCTSTTAAVELAHAATGFAQSAVRRVQHWRRLHSLALVLLRKGEYQRCHHLLAKAIQEESTRPITDTTAAPASKGAARSAAAAVDEEQHAAASSSSPSPDGVSESTPQPRPARREEDDENDEERLGSSPRVPFAHTTTPPCLQFLCLYALFLDGQRATMVSTASTYPGGGPGGAGATRTARAPRALNPHLRVLRGMLLEALANSHHHHHHPHPHSRVETTTASAPSSAAETSASPATPGALTTPLSRTDVRTAQWLMACMRLDHASRPSTPSQHAADASHASQEEASRARPQRASRTSSAHTTRGTASASAAAAGACCSGAADPYLNWLLGVILRDLGMKQESAAHLLASVQAHPFLWCAWQDLATLVSRDGQLEDIVQALMPPPPPAAAAETEHTETEGVSVLALMTSIFLAHTRATLGVAPTPVPRLVDLSALPTPPSTRTAATGAAGATTTRERVDDDDDASLLGRRTRNSPGEDEVGDGRGTQPRPDREGQGLDMTPRASQEAHPPSLSSSLKGTTPGGAGGTSAAAAAAAGMMPTGSPMAAGMAGLTTWELLLRAFPRNAFFRQQLAGYRYHQCRDMDAAQRLYERLLRDDPYRLEGTTDYSNILFMRSDRLSLSSLAQRCYQLDPFRAESNFVVGNYYVLLRQHERSVLHFRRAVAVQPQFVAAWTLLGHAYLETRNTTAAVEAYSVAVELDPRDYRGWYNLGQVYELLQAYHHALYYYWHTTALRATDPRMWMAVANCLEHDGRLHEAVVCLARAEACESPAALGYPALARRIAEHYIGESNMPRACVYLQKLVSAHTATAEDLVFALPFLVQQRLREVERLVEMPARSPSYDSALLRHGSGSWQRTATEASPNASATTPGAVGLTATAATTTTTTTTTGSRVERALALLAEVDHYLNTMEHLDVATPSTASTLAVDGLAEARSPSPSGSSSPAVRTTETRRGERSSALADFIFARRRDVQMNRSVIQYSCGGQA